MPVGLVQRTLHIIDRPGENVQSTEPLDHRLPLLLLWSLLSRRGLDLDLDASTTHENAGYVCLPLDTGADNTPGLVLCDQHVRAPEAKPWVGAEAEEDVG